MRLSGVDTLLVVLYGAALFLPLIRFRARRPAAEDFFVAARRVSMPAFVASLVSTWYGGVLGVGEYSFTYGLSNWIVFGVPYYLWAAIFAVFMAGRAHEKRHVSLPDLLYERYGRVAGVLGSSLLFITTVPAVYAMELGLLLAFMTGMSLPVAIVLGSIFTAAYVFYGGLRSVIDTDIIQFLLMFAGFSVLLPVLYRHQGGWEFLARSLPALHLSWGGGVPLQSILVWYVIASSTMVEPAFYQRCYSARSASTARWGILASIGFWALFDFMTTFTGLYARALLPPSSSALMSYPEMGVRYLPPVLCGLFFLGMLSTVMSTLHGYLFIAGEILGHDIVRSGGESRGRDRTRAGILLAAAISAGLAVWSRSIVRLWHDLGSLTSAALLLPVVFGYWSRREIAPRRAALSIALSAAVTLAWLCSRHSDGSFLLGIEPVFPGVATSAAILFWPSRRGANPE